LAEEARFSGLSDIQRAAERWGATILVITGLLTTLTAVRGPTDLAALQRLWPDKVIVGVLAGAALVLALVSVILAAVASQGSAVKMIASGPQYRDASLRAASIANNRLIWSRRLAVAIIPLYLGAIGVMSYSPLESEKPPSVTLTDKSGSVYCGSTIKRSGRDILLYRENEKVIRLRLEDLSNISAVSSCDKPGR
jgi:hypothetical protein